MADLEGDTASQYKLQQELEELESRATELDRKRTNNISSIRSAADILVDLSSGVV